MDQLSFTEAVQSPEPKLRINAIKRMSKNLPENVEDIEGVMRDLLKDEDESVLHCAYNKARTIAKTIPRLQDVIVRQLVENIWLVPRSYRKAKRALRDVVLYNEGAAIIFAARIQEEFNFRLKFKMLLFVKLDVNNRYYPTFEILHQEALFDIFKSYENKKIMLEVVRSLDGTFNFYDFFNFLIEKVETLENKQDYERGLLDYLKTKKSLTNDENLEKALKKMVDVFHSRLVLEEIFKKFDIKIAFPTLTYVGQRGKRLEQ